jgi:hypothetical protein
MRFGFDPSISCMLRNDRIADTAANLKDILMQAAHDAGPWDCCVAENSS